MRLFKNDRWWRSDEDAHEDLFSIAADLTEDQSEQRHQLLRYLSLYCNRQITEHKPGGAALEQYSFVGRNKLDLNVIQSCIDTLASKICSSRPTPQFLTAGGDHSLQERAKKLQKFTEGVFYDAGIYEEAARVFVDACVFGTGYLKVFEANDQVRCERVYPGEIIVDEASAMFAEPRAMYQRKWVPVEVLAEMYPEHSHDIEDSASKEGVVRDSSVVYHDVVEVIEGWHLKSGPKAKDGKHSICIKKATLLSEDYDEDYFPFCVFRWTQKPYGFYGIGLAEQLEGIQVEINKLLGRIQEAMHLFSVPMVFIRKGSFDKGKMSNIPGNIYEYEGGVPPQVTMPPSVSGEVFQHLWNLYSKAYEISGVSQLSAQSKKPAGVESGVAIRTILDVETQRFALTVKQWEEFFLDAARQVVNLARRTYGRSGKEVVWRAKDFRETIKWSDVDLERDLYTLQLYPTNMLPKEPAGRLQMIQDLLAGGMLTPQEGKALLEFPDIEKHRSLDQAAKDDIDRVLDYMLDTGEMIEPHPFQDLQLGIKTATNLFLRERTQNAPDDRLELLQRWIEMAVDVLSEPEPIQPPAPPPGEMPPGPPMPPGGGPPMMPPGPEAGAPPMPPGPPPQQPM